MIDLPEPVFLRFGVLVGLVAVPRLRFPVITTGASLGRVDLPLRKSSRSVHFGQLDVAEVRDMVCDMRTRPWTGRLTERV
jgi:hypothetical protein